MAEVQKKNGWTTTMRWAARLIGLAAAGLFVAFLVVSGSFVLSEMDWASPQGLPLVLALGLFTGMRLGVLLIVFAMTVIVVLSYYRRKLGCITGDMLGALIEVTEAGLLLAATIGES